MSEANIRSHHSPVNSPFFSPKNISCTLLTIKVLMNSVNSG